MISTESSAPAPVQRPVLLVGNFGSPLLEKVLSAHSDKTTSCLLKQMREPATIRDTALSLEQKVFPTDIGTGEPEGEVVKTKTCF